MAKIQVFDSCVLCGSEYADNKVFGNLRGANSVCSMLVGVLQYGDVHFLFRKVPELGVKLMMRIQCMHGKQK